VPALGLLALSRVPPERHGTAAGLFFAFFDAGVGAGGPLVGGVARLTTPGGALVVAAGAVAAAGLIGGRPFARNRVTAGPQTPGPMSRSTYGATSAATAARCARAARSAAARG
jgi:hypothetical protein